MCCRLCFDISDLGLGCIFLFDDSGIEAGASCERLQPVHCRTVIWLMLLLALALFCLAAQPLAEVPFYQSQNGGLLIMKTDIGYRAFNELGNLVVGFLNFTDVGSEFVAWRKPVPTPGQKQHSALWGFLATANKEPAER